MDWLTANAGVVGLIFFVTFFTVIVAWLFWPGAKAKFKSYGDIPLQEEDSDEQKRD